MCDKCKKNSCGGCGSGNSASNAGNSVEQLANQLAELSSTVTQLQEDTKAFACGHPILLIENKDDIDQFDFDSGKGIDCWDGWAICDGKQHYSKRAKKNIVTPNFTDRFIVQAGGEYAVDDTGGLKEVQLTISELPAHNHGITDNGHTHDITDPGHNHAITDNGHSHSGSSIPHTHDLSINAVGGHEHSTGSIGITDGGGGTGANVRTSDATPGNATSTEGAHSHSGTADPSAVGVTINDSPTGIHVDNSFIGITETETKQTGISIINQGGDAPHENRPPYFACLYVIKL